MYTVRSKGGHIVGRFATRAAAEACVRTSKSPANRVFEFRFLRGGLPPMVFYTKRGLDYWLRKNRPTPHSFEVIERPPHRGVEETAIREGRGNDGWLWKQSSPVRGSARTRLLKIHADVSKKLWAKSPKPKGYSLRKLRIDRGGYVNGRYFGGGAPLYQLDVDHGRTYIFRAASKELALRTAAYVAGAEVAGEGLTNILWKGKRVNETLGVW
jgi:hypothetical protein